MRKTESDVKNTLTQYQEDFLMYGKYNVESLNKVIDTLNLLHDKQTELEKLVTTKMFTEVENIGDALDYSVELQLFLELAQEEHVTKYKEVYKAGKELLDAIAILSQRRLPRSLFPDQRIKGILAQVDRMIKMSYPDYELAANHISHYRDMELVTFSVDRITHSLVVTFPVFIKDFKQPPLSLFEIETVPVPIPDKNRQADSYSQVRIQKDYIAAGLLDLTSKEVMGGTGEPVSPLSFRGFRLHTTWTQPPGGELTHHISFPHFLGESNSCLINYESEKFPWDLMQGPKIAIDLKPPTEDNWNIASDLILPWILEDSRQ